MLTPSVEQRHQDSQGKEIGFALTARIQTSLLGRNAIAVRFKLASKISESRHIIFNTTLKITSSMRKSRTFPHYITPHLPSINQHHRQHFILLLRNNRDPHSCQVLVLYLKDTIGMIISRLKRVKDKDCSKIRGYGQISISIICRSRQKTRKAWISKKRWKKLRGLLTELCCEALIRYGFIIILLANSNSISLDVRFQHYSYIDRGLQLKNTNYPNQNKREIILNKQLQIGHTFGSQARIVSIIYHNNIYLMPTISTKQRVSDYLPINVNIYTQSRLQSFMNFFLILKKSNAQLIKFFFQFYNRSLMSLRKAKQLLQKKKQIQQLSQNKQQEQQQIVEVKPKTSNAFAMFGGDDSDEEQVKPSKKQQSKEIEQTQQKQDKKKKKKKNKGKVNEVKQDQQLKELKEVESAFKELGFQPKTQQQKVEQKQEDEWSSILLITEGKFNYQKELRRHFRGWQPEKQEGDPDLSRKQQKMQKHLKKMMKKSVLSPGLTEYFPIRQKFEMVREDDSIKFVATKKYESLQREYDIIRNSNDVNALFQFTQFNPEHVDSLYAVGQFLRLQGNYRDADGLIQRVIYIYQMAGGYDMMEFIRQPLLKKFIVYDNISTSLFMSLFKFMDILGKKGCFRTALQYNKILLKINMNDPTACLLCIDFNSISSKSYQFLIDFVHYFGHYIGQRNNSIYLMPNFTYSLALSKFMLMIEPPKESQLLVQENNLKQLIQFKDQHWNRSLQLPKDHSYIEEDPRTLILRAIMVFPRLIVDIAVKNQYGKQFLNHECFQEWQKKPFQQIVSHEFWATVPTSYSYHFLKLDSVDDSRGLDKILQVYVQRSKILWKSNNVMLWVKGAMGFILNKLQQQFDYQSYLQKLCLEEVQTLPLPFNLSRYSNINKNNFSDRVERIDLNNIQDNQQVRQQPQGQTLNMNQNPFALFLNSLLPWVNLPNAQQQNAEFDPDMPFIEEDDN